VNVVSVLKQHGSFVNAAKGVIYVVKVENTMSYTFDEPSFVVLCDCHENHVELLDETVEHVKREYYWIVKEFICMNCEMSWIKRTYCVGKGDNWEITQLPTGEEE